MLRRGVGSDLIVTVAWEVFLALARGEVATGVTVEPPGVDAARAVKVEDRLERGAGGDGSEVVGDEAVGISGRCRDRGGNDLLAGGGRGVDAIGGRVEVRVAAGVTVWGSVMVTTESRQSSVVEAHENSTT